MKYLNKFLLVLVIGGLAACSSFTEDLDTDPNRLTDVDAAQILQGPILADMLFHAGEASRLAGMWDNHFTGQDRQYVGLMNWNSVTGGDMDSPWGTAYYGVLKQARIIQDKTDISGNMPLKGAAQVLEAHIMGTVTSLWGDVPYTEAANDTEFPNPAWDDQTAVYAGIQATLDDAITNLAGGGGSIPADADIYYGGNAAQWTELAYSLKARYYLHVGNYPAALAAAANGISSAANDLIAPFGNSFYNTFNPYYDFMVYQRGGYMGADDAYAPSMMDPDGNFTNIYGYNRNHANHDEGSRFYYNYTYYELYTAGYEPNYLNGFDWGCEDCGKFGEEFPLVTYGETLLIIAEAEARINGLSAGVTAYNTYRALIDGGYGFNDNLGEAGGWNFPAYADADFSPAGVEDPGSTASSPVNALLREIYEERYVALSGITETWTDFRRTNNIAEIQLKSYTGTPQRFVIPQSEINANSSTPDGASVTTATEVHGGS